MNEEELNEEESFEPDPSQGVAEPDFTLDKALLTKGKTLLGVGTSAIVRNIYTKISKIDGVQEMLTKAQERLPSISQKGVEEFKTQAAGRIEEIMRKLSESSFDVETLKRAVGKNQGGGFGGGGLPSDDDDDEEEDVNKIYEGLEGEEVIKKYQEEQERIVKEYQERERGDDLPTAEGTKELFDEIGLQDDVKLSIKEMLDEDKTAYFRRKGKAAIADPAFEWNMYEKTRKTLVKDFLEGIEFLNIDPASIHAHHIAGLRVTSSLFDGLDAAGRKQLMHVLLNEGIATGNNPANLMALHKVPHIKVIHKYLSDHLGKYGDKLLEPDIMKRLSVKERIPYAKKFAERIRISQALALEENRKFVDKAAYYNDPRSTMGAAVDIYEYEKSLKEVLRALNAQDVGMEQLLKIVQEGKRYKKRGITKQQQESLDKAIEEGMLPYQPLIDPTEDAFY